jgi:hypothetical protein
VHICGTNSAHSTPSSVLHTNHREHDPYHHVNSLPHRIHLTTAAHARTHSTYGYQKAWAAQEVTLTRLTHTDLCAQSPPSQSLCERGHTLTVNTLPSDPQVACKPHHPCPCTLSTWLSENIDGTNARCQLRTQHTMSHCAHKAHRKQTPPPRQHPTPTHKPH